MPQLAAVAQDGRQLAAATGRDRRQRQHPPRHPPGSRHASDRIAEQATRPAQVRGNRGPRASNRQPSWPSPLRCGRPMRGMVSAGAVRRLPRRPLCAGGARGPADRRRQDGRSGIRDSGGAADGAGGRAMRATRRRGCCRCSAWLTCSRSPRTGATRTRGGCSGCCPGCWAASRWARSRWPRPSARCGCWSRRS